MSFDLTITAETGRALVPFLREQVRAAHEVLQSRRGKQRGRSLPLRELSLALVNDARMSDLHEEFMGINAPTDVLTFPIDQDAAGNVTSGEVVVCVPEARRQSKLRGIPVRLELLLYSLHGMLHLLGYDDRTARDFETMHRTEDDILTRLGFGSVFAAPPPGGRGSRRAASMTARKPARREPCPPAPHSRRGR